MSLPSPDFSRLAPPAGEKLLVIGGCGGIGRNVAAAAEAEGLSVCVMDLPHALEDRGVDNGVPVDLRDEASIVTAFQTVDKVFSGYRYCLVASGYTSDLQPVTELEAASFDDVYSGNLRGVAFAAREAGRRISAQPGGAMVFVTTGIAQIGAKGYAAYAAAKAGVNALTRILAAETAPNMRVNAVAPGAVDTAFIRGGYGRGGVEEGPPARISIEAYEKMVPLGRIAAPEDITGPILFLLSDAARYVTGQVLHVSGGAMMRD